MLVKLRGLRADTSQYGVPTMCKQITASMVNRTKSMCGTDLCCLGTALLEGPRRNIVPQMVFDVVIDRAARKLNEIVDDDEAWSTLQSNSEFLKAVLTDAGALIAGE